MEMMRANRWVVILTILFIAILVGSLAMRFKNSQSDDGQEIIDDSEQIISYPVSYVEPTKEMTEAEKLVDSMSLEEKVGQLFSFGFEGYSLTAEEQSFLTTYKPGGVVIQRDNIADENNVRSLTSQIQTTNPKLKLFTMVDQEGGVVERIWWDPVGSAKDLAYMGFEVRCEEFKKRSSLLNGLGINFNLGIVADVTSNTSSFIYDRVFTTSYDLTARTIADAVNCFGEVTNVVKHYPGHGATSLDTHITLANISKSQSDWETTDLVPFKNAVDSGYKSIMLGHLILDWLDANNPSSLSKASNEYLRNNLNFDGLLITDDMRMLQSSGFDRSDALRRAILAGNNMLLYSTAETAEKTDLMNYAISEIRNGLISEEELNARVLKIVELKIGTKFSN